MTNQVPHHALSERPHIAANSPIRRTRFRNSFDHDANHLPHGIPTLLTIYSIPISRTIPPHYKHSLHTRTSASTAIPLNRNSQSSLISTDFLSTGQFSMANGSIALAMAVTAVAAIAVSVCASDPDPLQDFCIADLTSWTRVNGYPCRDPLKATDEDFVYRGLRTGSDTSKEFGGPIKPAYVQQWPALNTQAYVANPCAS